MCIYKTEDGKCRRYSQALTTDDINSIKDVMNFIFDETVSCSLCDARENYAEVNYEKRNNTL